MSLISFWRQLIIHGIKTIIAWCCLVPLWNCIWVKFLWLQDVLHYIFWFFYRDGRIKVIGGDNIEALLVSPQQLPYKYLEVFFTIKLLSASKITNLLLKFFYVSIPLHFLFILCTTHSFIGAPLYSLLIK